MEFVFLAQPEAFRRATRKLTGVRAQRIHLGLADATGRQAPQAIEGSHFTLSGRHRAEGAGLRSRGSAHRLQAPELAVTRWGTMKIDHRSMMTNLPGVFAAGDIVRGASLVVWAIRDGRDAAEHIHGYVTRKAEVSAAVGVAAE